MLASPDTLPLFLKKYQAGGLKQYKRRQPVYKGAGDIICYLDESGSTWGDTAAWAKAIAMALLDIAVGNGRNFALIHFSGAGSFKTDVFKPNAYQTEDKLRAAETFLDGGIDFETPLTEAVRLIHDEGFENADIVFITDGECDISESFTDALKKEMSLSKISITGILLDALSPGTDFSIKQVCETIYRTSELTGDEITTNLFMNRI